MPIAHEMRPLLHAYDWQLSEREGFVADMREAGAGKPYQGYPELADRLYIPAGHLLFDQHGRPKFPSDPDASHTVYDHSVNPPEPRPAHAFHDTGGPLPPAEAARIRWGDMGRDSRGFPLHRFWKEMVTDPTIGAVVGPGYYYHPGKTHTADLGVLALAMPSEVGTDEYGMTPAVQASEEDIATGGLYLAALGVLRADTQQWAFPGGEIDEGERAAAAALRETREETGLLFDGVHALTKAVRADPRLTTCTEVEGELFAHDAGTIPDQQPAGDPNEVAAVKWLVTDGNMLAPHRFFGAHRRMLFEVVDWYQRRHDVTVMQDGLIVPSTGW